MSQRVFEVNQGGRHLRVQAGWASQIGAFHLTVEDLNPPPTDWAEGIVYTDLHEPGGGGLALAALFERLAALAIAHPPSLREELLNDSLQGGEGPTVVYFEAS